MQLILHYWLTGPWLILVAYVHWVRAQRLDSYHWYSLICSTFCIIFTNFVSLHTSLSLSRISWSHIRNPEDQTLTHYFRCHTTLTSQVLKMSEDYILNCVWGINNECLNFHFYPSGFYICLCSALDFWVITEQGRLLGRTLFVCLHSLIYAFVVFVYGQLICTQYKYF